MIAELWADPEGKIYYRLDNWGGFWETIGGWGSDRIDSIPDGSVLILRDGQWIGGVLEAAIESQGLGDTLRWLSAEATWKRDQYEVAREEFERRPFIGSEEWYALRAKLGD